MRLVVGVVISLAAVLGIVAALARTTKTELVVAVQDPVSLGQVISRGDLTVKTVGAADGVASVPAGQLGQMVGKVAHSPLYPGEVLPPQAVAAGPTVPAGDVAVTLALAPEQAVGGIIAPGDQVAVLSTSTGLATTGSSSSVALPAVTVLSVSKGATVGENQYLVSVILPAGEAPALDAAYRGGKVDLALVGG